MSNGNPFYVHPGGDYSQAMAGLGSAIRGYGERRDEEEGRVRAENRFKEAKSAAMVAFKSGDSDQIAEMAIEYPEMQQTAQMMFGITNERTKQEASNTYRSILADPDNTAKYLSEGINRVSEEDGRPDNMLSDLGMYRANPEEALKKIEMGYAVTDPEGYKALKGMRAAEKVEPDKFKMGSGAMAGYSFDETTGDFSIDPKLKASLAKDASKKAAKTGMLSSKDITGINDKVTGLTKGVSAIYSAAKSMDALKGRSTAAAKLAAVFMFMKALDPTSVVRREEQGQVYASGGILSQFVGKLNGMLGDGELGDDEFDDLVETSKTLANSATDSSKIEVEGYLNVLSNKIPKDDYDKMLARVPPSFGDSGGTYTTTTKQTPQDADRQKLLDDLSKKYGAQYNQ